jgi:mannose-6-phosphate isomerase-like protein (cupin superfamily)
MIHRYFKDGVKPELNDTNQVTVLIGRDETELTEVIFNQSPPELEGPKFTDNGKDQIIFITSGMGILDIENRVYKVKKGCCTYIPSGILFQIKNKSSKPLCYLLYNIYKNKKSEEYKTSHDRIDKIKPAGKQIVDSIPDAGEKVNFGVKSKFYNNIHSGKKFEFGSNSTILLLDRNETNKCELTLVSWPSGNKGALVAHKEKEQTFFILNGHGWITIDKETDEVKSGDLIFVPRNTPHTTQAANCKLSYLCMNALSGEIQDDSFEEMYKRVSPDRIKRWVSNDETVGE